MKIIMSSGPSCAIVIPVYKKEINYFEKASLKQCIKVFKDYPIILIAPRSLDTGNYTRMFPFKIERFEDDSFVSVRSYSRLLLLADFYSRFKSYSYILMYQPDAYVFRNELEYWCSQDYDYIGASVPERPLTDLYKYNLLDANKKGSVFFGNGGFSLRKVDTFIDVLSQEDAEIDTYPAQTFKASNNKLPFGCHGWYRNDSEYYDAYFWLPKIFPVRGYLYRSFIYKLLLRS